MRPHPHWWGEGWARDPSWTSLLQLSASLMARFPELAQVDEISESHCHLEKGLHSRGTQGALGRTKNSFPALVMLPGRGQALCPWQAPHLSLHLLCAPGLPNQLYQLVSGGAALCCGYTVNPNIHSGISSIANGCLHLTNWANPKSHSSIFFFFSFLCGIWKFLGQGLNRAAAASLCHSHSNTRSEPHLRSIPQLTAMPDPLSLFPGMETMSDS